MAAINPKSSGLSELWSRLRFVLLALIIYRIGTHIPVPGIDPVKISSLFDQNQELCLACSICFLGCFGKNEHHGSNVVPILLQLL